MAQSSNPSFPSRFNAGSGSYSKGFADASPVRPPMLTAQGREDVERLRAKVRAHNPGYVYTNGVSLPSQLPSVPELLDELARNVAGAKIRSDVPSTPLPEVEPSELAKAGFDWRAIADRAITALERGSHRPLPLANDPEAASIPGLSVIAAVGTAPIEETKTEESGAEEPQVEPKEQLVEVAPLNPPHSANQPEPENTVLPVVQSVPEADVYETPLNETPSSEEETLANFVAPSENSVLGEPAALAPMEPLAAVPDVPGEANQLPDTQITQLQPFDTDLPLGELEGEEPHSEPEMEVMPPLPPQNADETGEELAEVLPLNLGLEPQPDLSEEVASAAEEAATGTLPQADDLTQNRVYDDEVLEPEGNDDELFVGDIEGKPATWEPPVEAETAPQAQDAALADAAVPLPASPEEETPTPPEESTENLEAELPESLDELPQDDAGTAEPGIDTEAETSDTPMEQNLSEAISEAQDFASDEELPEDEAGQDPLGDALPETTQTAEPETFEEETGETGLDDLDLEDLDLNVLDEIPVEDTMESELSETFGETEQFETAEAGADDLDGDSLPESLPETNSDQTEDLSDTVLNDPEEAAPETEAAPQTDSPDLSETPGELPGSIAIGSEAAEPMDELTAADLAGVDLGEFALEEGEFSEALTGEEQADSPDYLEYPTADEPDELSAGGFEEVSAQAGDEAGTAELDFEIPQVQGDIPQAMQEGFSEWDPTSDTEAETDLDNEIGADTALFESEQSEWEDLSEPTDEPPAKKGFFQRLFGRS